MFPQTHQKSLAMLIAVALASSAQAATYVDIPLPSVRDHAFTQDGHLLISSGNQLIQYDLLSCSSVSLLTADRQLMGVDVSEDDSFVAVAAAGLTDGRVGVYYKNRHGTRSFPQLTYAKAFGESGSFMPAWTPDNRLLISGSYAGSGWVPLREFNPTTDQVVTLNSITQNSMLDSGPSKLTGIVESNISSGPVHAWDNKEQRIEGSVNTSWFVFEVAVSPDGSRYVVPTYQGAHVYDLGKSGLVLSSIIGTYANHGPLAAVFSADGKKTKNRKDKESDKESEKNRTPRKRDIPQCAARAFSGNRSLSDVHRGRDDLPMLQF